TSFGFGIRPSRISSSNGGADTDISCGLRAREAARAQLRKRANDTYASWCINRRVDGVDGIAEAGSHCRNPAIVVGNHEGSNARNNDPVNVVKAGVVWFRLPGNAHAFHALALPPDEYSQHYAWRFRCWTPHRCAEWKHPALR